MGSACKKCGSPNLADAKYCATCGQLMPVDTENPRLRSLICDKCGSENLSDSKFCYKCGEPLNVPLSATKTDEKRICPACSHTQPEGDYCEKCGGRLAPEPAESSLQPKKEEDKQRLSRGLLWTTCPTCGARNGLLATGCASCGAPIESPKSKEPAARPRKGELSGEWRAYHLGKFWARPRNRYYLAVLVCLLVIVIAAIVHYSTGGSKTQTVASTSTTEIAASETLPPIQTPVTLSSTDWLNADTMLSVANWFSKPVGLVQEIAARYPNWSDIDQHNFGMYIPEILSLVSGAALVPGAGAPNELSLAFAQGYGLVTEWNQMLSDYQSACGLLQSALQSRSATQWQDGVSDLQAATTSNADISVRLQQVMNSTRYGS